ncbi:NADPH-dependent F420 reductase [Lacisediminihabitans sp.]|jgi:predicted dinucleotide-binding enzyme|uniref:NADPH-dependent F420 reductase n=1 Tax=Lacisediminihabitans sp. TaxID=2787631 RepID=UPI002F9539AE
MADITIIGAGNMGAAIAAVAVAGGNAVQVLARDAAKAAAANPSASAGVIGDPITGDIVVLAVPFGAVPAVVAELGSQLDGKILVDISNPVDFSTFDSLVVPADGSAAQEIAALVPSAKVLKAFNTNFAATLHSGRVGDEGTTVIVAGDDVEAKAALIGALAGSGVAAVDGGSLRRARELEALGFLQLTLAAGEKTSWTSGFALAG